MKQMRASAVLVIALFGVTGPASAQWLKYPTPGIPRTPDGKANFSAPAPRTQDGKPDFSGVWGFDGGPSMFYLPAGLKPSEIKPWVADLLKQRGEDFGRGDQQVRCLPEGPRFNLFPALPRKIVQTPSLIVVLSEDLTFRQIFLDGRPLPENPSPSFMGYSVGRWEGDTLVVESIGFKDSTWLDFAGNPHSEALRVTERYRRVDFGHIEIQESFRDSDVYSRPLTAQVKATLVPDTDLLEYVCAENEKDRGKLIGTISEDQKSIKPVKVARAVLSQYVGTYDFRWPENPTIATFWPVTLDGEQLFLQGAPLIPVSDTEFVWAAGNRLKFFKDASGRVTHFVVGFVEGDMVVKRVPDKR